MHSLTSIVIMPPRVQSGLRTILQEGTLLPRTQMLIQNFFSAVSYGVMDPDSAKEKARLKTQEDNRKLGFPDRPVHGLPPRIPVGLDLVDAADARCALLSSFAEVLAIHAKAPDVMYALPSSAVEVVPSHAKSPDVTPIV